MEGVFSDAKVVDVRGADHDDRASAVIRGVVVAKFPSGKTSIKVTVDTKFVEFGLLDENDIRFLGEGINVI